MTSLGAVFEDFSDEVIVYVCDPRTGIQRRAKWPPTISEVIEACEQHQDHLRRLRAPRPVFVKRASPQLLLDRPPGSCAQVFVPQNHPRYASLVAWADDAQTIWWKYGKSSDGRDGIWVSHDAWNNSSTGQLRYSDEAIGERIAPSDAENAA